MVILLVSTFPVRCLHPCSCRRKLLHLFLNICFIFCPSKTSLTCCREASTQSDESRWGWCVPGHVVCLLSLKTPRLTLKILQFEQIPESSSGLPLHLSHIFRCTFLVIQNLNPETSPPQPVELSQLHRRLGRLGVTFYPFTNDSSAISGIKTIVGCLFSPPSQPQYVIL